MYLLQEQADFVKSLMPSKSLKPMIEMVGKILEFMELTVDCAVDDSFVFTRNSFVFRASRAIQAARRWRRSLKPWRIWINECSGLAAVVQVQAECLSILQCT